MHDREAKKSGATFHLKISHLCLAAVLSVRHTAPYIFSQSRERGKKMPVENFFDREKQEKPWACFAVCQRDILHLSISLRNKKVHSFEPGNPEKRTDEVEAQHKVHTVGEMRKTLEEIHF